MEEDGVYHLENTTSKVLQNFNPYPVPEFSVCTGSFGVMEPPKEIFAPKPEILSIAPTAMSDTSSETTTKSKKTQRVEVVVRVRPPIKEDYKNSFNGEITDCTTIGKQKNVVTLTKNIYETRDFPFDNVVAQESSQETVYNLSARNIVQDVLKGYNGTILAYGQTGTGKTFTIFGPGTHWELGLKRTKQQYQEALMKDDSGLYYPSGSAGVIPRSVLDIFSHIQKNSSHTEFRVTVSFLQIYMENIMDLLDPAKIQLNIREDPKQGIFVDSLTHVVVQEPQDIIQLIKEGSINRRVSCTNMNKVSSRSHVVLNITVEQKPLKNTPIPDGTICVKRGTLSIVDLAGSERVSKSGSEGKRLEEAKKINKSLSALGNCVAALTDGSSNHVPFRDSKLTRLLTDSLGGNAKTTLIATIGPALVNYDESYSTLLFATRAMAVKNHAVINEVVDFKTLSGDLAKKISIIESEKHRLLAKNVDLEKEVASLRDKVNQLQQKKMDVNQSKKKSHSVPPALQKDDDDNEEDEDEMTDSNSFVFDDEAPLHRPKSAGGTSNWEERERELIAKFQRVISHLQNEIAKQSMITLASSAEDSDTIIDQLINGFLNIPSIRKKILEKLKIQEPQVSQQPQIMNVSFQLNHQ